MQSLQDDHVALRVGRVKENKVFEYFWFSPYDVHGRGLCFKSRNRPGHEEVGSSSLTDY